MRTKPFSFKIEEFVPVNEFTLASYTNDQPQFLLFSPKYSVAHLAGCKTQLDIVNQILNPKGLTSQMKNATERLQGLFKDTLTHVDAIQRYVEMCGTQIPVKVKDFGFSAIRKKCHSSDAEGVLSRLKLVDQLATPNLTLLVAQGYTADKQAAFKQLQLDIANTNIEYNGLLNQRIKLVQDNIGLFTEFWDKMRDVLKSGKTIFKADPAKKQEYTQAAILRRVRRDKGDSDADTGGTGTKG